MRVIVKIQNDATDEDLALLQRDLVELATKHEHIITNQVDGSKEEIKRYLRIGIYDFLMRKGAVVGDRGRRKNP